MSMQIACTNRGCTCILLHLASQHQEQPFMLKVGVDLSSCPAQSARCYRAAAPEMSLLLDLLPLLLLPAFWGAHQGPRLSDGRCNSGCRYSAATAHPAKGEDAVRLCAICLQAATQTYPGCASACSGYVRLLSLRCGTGVRIQRCRVSASFAEGRPYGGRRKGPRFARQ